MLRFYDGLCSWEEDSTTPVLHIGWVKPIVKTFLSFDHAVRRQLSISTTEQTEGNQVLSFDDYHHHPLQFVPDTINNNNNTVDANSNEQKVQQKLIVPTPHAKVDLEKRIGFNRSRELMSSLCAANPQFTSSVLEDYIRPIFREGDVVLEVECGNNAAVM